MTARDAHSVDARLASLAAKMAAARNADPADFDWSRTTSLPAWLPRRLAARAIVQFYLGEIATAHACERIERHIALPAAHGFLSLQAADERRHAALYRAYLDRIGGVPRRQPAIATTYRRALDWRGGPEGIILAFHVVLEGESLRLQRVIDKWLPCPLFRDISAAIARDEARHIAFGRIYLRAALPHLSRGERRVMFRWTRDLWFDAVRDAVADFAPPGLFSAGGGYRNWVAQVWRERLDDLESLGLFTPDERSAFVGP